MECAFCGEELTGSPVRQNGHTYCSVDCAEMAAEVGIDEDELELGDEEEEDDLDLDYSDDYDEY